MAYVKITNGNVDTYPYSVGKLRRDNPNTSFPKQIPDEMLESYGVLSVTFPDRPNIDDRTQKIAQEAEPSLVSGAWTIGWTTSSKTAEETQAWDDNMASSNRTKRDGLLAETDWLTMRSSDTATPVPSAWHTYRQALRDITSHANWPNLEEADWPTKP